MSFQTAAFAAQDALVSILRDVPELSAWTIDYGLPPAPEERHIWVDEEIEEGTQETSTSGLVARSESFRLTVYVYDRQTGASAIEVRDEIKTAAGYVADAIGAAPFLGGSVLYAEVAGFAYEGAFKDPEGRVREGVLRLTVACQSYLTAA